jgi:hypothetical protein
MLFRYHAGQLATVDIKQIILIIYNLFGQNFDHDQGGRNRRQAHLEPARCGYYSRQQNPAQNSPHEQFRSWTFSPLRHASTHPGPPRISRTRRLRYEFAKPMKMHRPVAILILPRVCQGESLIRQCYLTRGSPRMPPEPFATARCIWFYMRPRWGATKNKDLSHYPALSTHETIILCRFHCRFVAAVLSIPSHTPPAHDRRACARSGGQVVRAYNIFGFLRAL